MHVVQNIKTDLNTFIEMFFNRINLLICTTVYMLLEKNIRWEVKQYFSDFAFALKTLFS